MGDSDYQGIQTRPSQVRLFCKMRRKQNKYLKRSICTNSPSSQVSPISRGLRTLQYNYILGLGSLLAFQVFVKEVRKLC
jgi:hypothetical protein